MTIIPSLPNDIIDGTVMDAVPVMENFNTIVNYVNANAAANGANSDITSISGLTTPLSVSQGGTGEITAPTARVNLGAAASGANSDITSLTQVTSVAAPSGKTLTIESDTGILATILDGVTLQQLQVADAVLPQAAVPLSQIASLITGVFKTVHTQLLTTATGTYTPTAGMIYAVVIGVGSGGSGGGGAPLSGSPSGTGGGSGGGGGEAGINVITAAQASGGLPYAIGVSPAGGPTGANGIVGNPTTLGSSGLYLSCAGGNPGFFVSTPGTRTPAGGSGGSSSGAGLLKIPGGAGGIGDDEDAAQGGFGGSAIFGPGGANISGSNTPGNAGRGYGGGGGGGLGGSAGGAGAAGAILIIEFCTQ